MVCSVKRVVLSKLRALFVFVPISLDPRQKGAEKHILGMSVVMFYVDILQRGSGG
ncbi:hypothetical protein [Bartonella senegalensis]|uniref:hypothetical protein n=1 Tax=Bartonella senegalensis TaxID=1468418 RepID=UPI0012B600D2|nr:hypothetical protein [Bartonella senegalensis]